MNHSPKALIPTTAAVVTALWLSQALGNPPESSFESDESQKIGPAQSGKTIGDHLQADTQATSLQSASTEQVFASDFEGFVPEFLGMDFDGDGVADIGVVGDALASVLNFSCRTTLDLSLVVNPPGNYDWDSSGAEPLRTTDGTVSGAFGCDFGDEDIQETLTYTVSNETGSDTLNVTYNIQADPLPEVYIRWADRASDGTYEFEDIDRDGQLEFFNESTNRWEDISPFGVNCRLPPGAPPFDLQLVVDPDVVGNFNLGDPLPENMTFDQGTGITTYLPDCENVGEIATISYTYDTITGQTTPPLTVQYRVVR